MNNEESSCLIIKPRNTFNMPLHYAMDEFDDYKKRRKILNQQYLPIRNKGSGILKQKEKEKDKHCDRTITYASHYEPRILKKEAFDGNDWFSEIAYVNSEKSENIKRIVDIMKPKEQYERRYEGNVTAGNNNTITKAMRNYSSANKDKDNNKSRRHYSIETTMKKLLAKRKDDKAFEYLLKAIDQSSK